MKHPTGQRVVVAEWGETPLDALDHHITLEPQPAPEQLGPHDVLLRVRSCAVGWVDLIMSSGQYQHMVEPPYTPGLEFAGDVVDVGDAVKAVAPGDRVLADGFQTGPRSSGDYTDGGFATYAVIPERAAIPIPDALDYDQAANLLGNYETAYHVLIHRARLQAAEYVLINGATGSTGLAGVHVAKLLGATVIATGRNPDKLAEVVRHGADHVIVTTDDNGALRRFKADVKALTGGHGVHVVWDGVGGPLSVESIRSMRFGGRFCIVGWAATPFVAKGKGGGGSVNPNMLPTNLMQMKGLDVLGCPAVISTLHDPTLRPTRLKWLLEQVESGAISPHAGPAFDLPDYDSAMRAKWHSEHVGGCVIRP
jgi:NADPH2:quinone reductase